MINEKEIRVISEKADSAIRGDSTDGQLRNKGNEMLKK